MLRGGHGRMRFDRLRPQRAGRPNASTVDCRAPDVPAVAARHHGWGLVLHGPRLGLPRPPGQERTDTAHQRTELATAQNQGLVTGGLMRWGQVRTP
jgi:hypothetical protein